MILRPVSVSLLLVGVIPRSSVDVDGYSNAEYECQLHTPAVDRMTFTEKSFAFKVLLCLTFLMTASALIA